MNGLQTSFIIFYFFVDIRELGTEPTFLKNVLRELEMEDADEPFYILSVRCHIFISECFSECIRVVYIFSNGPEKNNRFELFIPEKMP